MQCTLLLFNKSQMLCKDFSAMLHLGAKSTLDAIKHYHLVTGESSM